MKVGDRVILKKELGSSFLEGQEYTISAVGDHPYSVYDYTIKNEFNGATCPVCASEIELVPPTKIVKKRGRPVKPKFTKEIKI